MASDKKQRLLKYSHYLAKMRATFDIEPRFRIFIPSNVDRKTGKILPSAVKSLVEELEREVARTKGKQTKKFLLFLKGYV